MRAHDLALRIRERRSASGLSQKDLAERMSVSQPQISLWETGRTQPDLRQVDQLQEILGGINARANGTDVVDQESPAVAQWLSRALGKRNWTASELAKKAGVSAPTVYNLINGTAQNPRQRTLRALEQALGENLDRTKEEEESFRVRGIGDLIDFNPYDPTDIPADPGVYVFYDISGRPVYVGQSENIARRLRDYNDKFWFKSPIVQAGAYIKITERELRLQVETVLIQFLKNNAVINKQRTSRN